MKNIYCDWQGFDWIWDRDQKTWMIDLLKSGGPPSSHESPSCPPWVIIEEEDHIIISSNEQ